MNVQNIENERGNKVPNQFLIKYDNGDVVFQSYETTIARWVEQTKELLLYGNMWDYSNTTRKYFKQFVNEETKYSYLDKQDFLKKIELINYIKVI